MVIELNERSKQILRQIVDTYVETGEPIGSKTIASRLEQPVSPATVRNVMSSLEDAGLLYSPHTSAGRLPTDLGLRFYVDGLLQTGDISEDERQNIDSQCAVAGRQPEAVLDEAISTLSGLSRYAGLVLAPHAEHPFKQVEFVPLGPGRALVILVATNGVVENRVIDVPLGVGATTLIEAGNYLTQRIAGRTFAGVREAIELEMGEQRSQLDDLAQNVVQAGLATWSVDNARDESVLIVRGQAKLLNDVTTLQDLERIRALFEALETKKTMLRLLDLVQDGNGVQIFIGAENQLFGLSGCSMIVAPYREGDQNARVLGAIGVIGPTRMNYARIIPMVDYTARAVSRLLSHPITS
ncbi:MAG TPA: heat-inducible transcriptional repressor HrcA [Geminicoccaceae bacterium]